MVKLPVTDIARNLPVEESDLLLEKDRLTPGSVQYSIKRYRRFPHWNTEDAGMMTYHYKGEQTVGNYLELKFCVAGNIYCNNRNGYECDNCKHGQLKQCTNKEETVDILSFSFLSEHLQQFIKSNRASGFANDVLAFRHPKAFTRILSLCSRTRMTIEALLNNNSYTGNLENIFINAQTQMLLLYSLECMLGEKEEEVFTCKFLANDSDREKILKARELLLQHIGEPITIKDLSRKVAINECYLKKGFKEMFGTTIFDYYQSQRMEHAKYLLYEKGLSVTDVSLMLGYSSISHFSTAFKKQTGLKPCELLLR